MSKRNLYLADIKDEKDGILSLSFVKDPAIKSNLAIVSNDEDGFIIDAPILLSNELIYRNNEAYGEHDIMFTPDVISDIIKQSATAGTAYVFDIEHQTPISGVTLIESYQVDYTNRIMYNKALTGITDGSWIGKFAITNENLKSKILDKQINGISISGVFSYEPITLKDALSLHKLLNKK